MKPLLNTILLLAINSPIYAFHSINGWYGGIILGGSYAPSTNLTFQIPNTDSDNCDVEANCSQSTGTLDYSGFGNIGAQIGYRTYRYRLELEGKINNNPYQTITANNLKYHSPKSSDGIRLDGQTTTFLLMLNGYYDFVMPTNDGALDLVPYVGAGIGFAYMNNDMKFYCNDQIIQCTKISDNSYIPAIQGIAGVAYHLDDFTWFGFDFRYITTNKVDLLTNHPQIYTINLSFNGIFNCA